MKVIIAGSRSIRDRKAVQEAIAQSGFPITEVVCGCAPGVDRIGGDWALAQNLSVKYFPADWNYYGKQAGIYRNCQMGDYAEALIAVWDGQSPGTRHMIEYAKQKGLPVFVARYSPGRSGTVCTDSVSQSINPVNRSV